MENTQDCFGSQTLTMRHVSQIQVRRHRFECRASSRGSMGSWQLCQTSKPCFGIVSDTSIGPEWVHTYRLRPPLLVITWGGGGRGRRFICFLAFFLRRELNTIEGKEGCIDCHPCPPPPLFFWVFNFLFRRLYVNVHLHKNFQSV